MTGEVNQRRWVSETCEGELCFCGVPATRKVAEEFPYDHPQKYSHGLTSYVCFWHFDMIMTPRGQGTWNDLPAPVSTTVIFRTTGPSGEKIAWLGLSGDEHHLSTGLKADKWAYLPQDKDNPF